MSTEKDPGILVPVPRLNAELRHAHIELLSALCATDRLRLRFSVQDIVQHAQAELLRKAIKTSSSLHDFYSALANECSRHARIAQPAAHALDEKLVPEAIKRLSAYLREQRVQFFPQGAPLSDDQKRRFQAFFSSQLLDGIRIIELRGQRLPNPTFYDEARQLGIANLPQITHMSSLTFLDVVVFNDRATPRSMFHGLAHAVQFSLLGSEGYANAFVRGFSYKNSYFNVPLEVHVMGMESRFASGAQPFSVEAEVRQWIQLGRYVSP